MQFGCMAGEMGTFHGKPQKEENSVQCGMGEKGQRDIIYIYIYGYGYYIYIGHYIYIYVGHYICGILYIYNIRLIYIRHIYVYTHTHTHIYIYIYVGFPDVSVKKLLAVQKTQV